MDTLGFQWFCAQIGAREHYAVPRALHLTGRLGMLYTDFWAGPILRRTESLELGDRILKTGVLRSLASRWHQDLEDGVAQAVVHSWNVRALWWEVVRKTESRKRKTEKRQQTTGHETTDSFQFLEYRNTNGPYHGFIEVGRRFATCVRESLKYRKMSGPNSILFAYDTGALEAFEWCREHGVKCVLNQMDPNRVEVDLVRAEEKLWPGWTLGTVEVPEEYFARREREWALAHRVVVNSEFSRQALLQQGVPPEKLMVIPLCYEVKAESRKASITNPESLPADRGGEGEGRMEDGRWKAGAEDRNVGKFSVFPTIASQPSTGPLRVLFLGQVILRKGIQYLIATAKLLELESIRFDIVGPVGISAAALATAPKNMRFHGRTSRGQAAAWYRQSHLFVLPTLSDGFAITQLEAMAHGLPVVTTPCCGEVVSNGVDGFVVPARDAETLARVFQRYLSEPELLRNQSAAALVKARQFTPERLAENLRQLEDSLKKS